MSIERPARDELRDCVAAGGVSVVLAQDRDRFAREPAYHYLLKREFEEHGCVLRSLNDRGDESPEGELTDGILDQLAKFERAKTAERSRRGKLRKAREGKVIASSHADYGFKYNAARDGYELDEATMPIVRRIFRMVGLEGYPLRKVKQRFEAEELPTPTGKKYWSQTFIREVIQDDVYRPHIFEEVETLVTPEVAARLDPDKSYGIWWFNRKRHTSKQVAENTSEGKVYRRKRKTLDKPRKEWIAVPVPDAGIPRGWVESARGAIADNRRLSAAGHRFWELSGGILYCGSCGRQMGQHSITARGQNQLRRHFYYHCLKRWQHGKDLCQNHKLRPADKVEVRVWDMVSDLLKDPERLRADLDKMIELERNGVCGNPEREQKTWLDKLEEVDRKRARYQEMATDNLITFDELRGRLAELDDARRIAEHELETLRNHEERIAELEADRDALLDSLADIAPDALGSLATEERHHVYKMLRLRVVVH
jgi:site-specific DNA recombinase